MSIVRRYYAYILVLIFLAGFSLRFLWLDSAPQGLLIDEAHYGYIAHSLNETGRDEHGVSHPLVFKGFGDQKLPVQAYILQPFIKLMGLNAVSVRLPSVVAGSLLILVMFWLMRELGVKKELSLFGALLVALSPWPFLLSRFAYEANLALLMFTLGLVAMLKMHQVRGWVWGIASALMMAATWYTYVAFRPVTLLLVLGFLSYKLISKTLSWKMVLGYLLVLLLGIAPLFHPQVLQSSVSRFNQVGLLSDEGVVLQVNQERTFCAAKLPTKFCYMLSNKPLVYGKTLVGRFASVFATDFMFRVGDPQLIYQSPQNYGQFYLLLAPLLFFGLTSILFRAGNVEIENDRRIFLMLGLLVSPLPSMLAGEAQMVRLSPLLPFVVVTLVLGMQLIWDYLPQKPWHNVLGGLLTAYLLGAGVMFMTNYYTVHAIKNDLVYQSYLPELFNFFGEHQAVDIYIKPFFSDPIMAYAYYAQVEPQHYQENVVLGKLEGSGFQHAVALDNYYVTEEPMINVGCQALTKDKVAYYATNEHFDNPPIPYVYRAASENGAVFYGYVYDATQYAASHPELCL